MRFVFFPFFFIFGFFLFLPAALAAQASFQISPGAQSQLSALLNKPVMVRAPVTTSLGKGWYRLELDTHIFTNQADFRQIKGVMTDLNNHDRIFDGRLNKVKASIVSRSNNETIIDFTTIANAPLGIQVKTTYRASNRFLRDTAATIATDIRQLPSDTETNKQMKNLHMTRYAEEVEINGIKYTYIRVYSINDVNVSFIPNAGHIIENNAAPVNREQLELIINAAKNR